MGKGDKKKRRKKQQPKPPQKGLWDVRFKNKARKIKHLENNVKLAIDEAIECLKKEGPLLKNWGAKKLSGEKNKYQLDLARKGKNQYRMKYYSYKRFLIIEIIFAGHRKDADKH